MGYLSLPRRVVTIYLPLAIFLRPALSVLLDGRDDVQTQ